MQGKMKTVRQGLLFVSPQDLPQSPGHPFYEKLNGILKQAGFDEFLDRRCRQYYAACGRPGIPMGVYFRLLLIGFFEELDSQRGITWRCCDSLSLKAFLGLSLTEQVPDHSSLTRIRQRLELQVYMDVFGFILGQLRKHKLIQGRRLAIDSTPIAANAAMRSLRRKVDGAEWRDYVRELAAAEGIELKDEDDLQRYDRQRKDKRINNREWQSVTDRDSRITRMKDGSFKMSYKEEHVVDLDTDALVSVSMYPGDAADTRTFEATLAESCENLASVAPGAEFGPEVEDDPPAAEAPSPDAVETSPEDNASVPEQAVGGPAVAADKGYFSTAGVSGLTAAGIETCVKQPRVPGGQRNWSKYSLAEQQACLANEARNGSDRGQQLHALRQEKVERSFAHIKCTGGGLRTWLRGHENVTKHRLVLGMAFNLSVLMRKVWKVGKPRVLQNGIGSLISAFVYNFVLMPTSAWWCQRRYHSHHGAYQDAGHRRTTCTMAPLRRSAFPVAA